MGLLSMIFGKKDNSELKDAIANKAFVVDVRSPGEFNGGSVKGAVNIPLDQINNNIAKFKGKKQVVVFCRSGMRSGQAKSILERNGIENVINGGGINNMYTALSS
ncbi:rhodanese-like domain-containing protein [Flavobacterium ardleyense]|uniref:rhodanese-like domain-containing protein n=1 Tax=Flavobacterium ardleyense TaxID=2038737 RepID=UPI00298C3DCD|nr:rhodanese-like domain-containing protein [Flavobacterium ardleyense]